jgi:hypothetical protein
VPAAFDRGEAVPRLELLGGGREICDRNHDVVELHL